MILGFDSHGVYRMDDTLISDEILATSLESLLEDKLYGHSWKRMI